MSERTKEDRAIEALIVLALWPNTADLTDEEIKQFMAEYDGGLHPLSDEDKAALERAKPDFTKPF